MTELNLQTRTGNSPVYVLNCFIQGFKMLAKPELRKFLIIPLMINLILYTVILALGYYYVAGLIEQFIPSWIDWLSWLIWPLFFISFFVIGFFTFTLLANLIAAPFYSKLAAKTVATLTGQSDTEIFEQPALKSIMSELRRIIYILLRALPLLILFIIPGLNLLAPILWLLFVAWCLALEYMAYPLENRGLLFEDQRLMVKSKRMGALSFGGLVVVGLSIPIINIIIPPVTVIAATLYFQGVQEQHDL